MFVPAHSYCHGVIHSNDRPLTEASPSSRLKSFPARPCLLPEVLRNLLRPSLSKTKPSLCTVARCQLLPCRFQKLSYMQSFFKHQPVIMFVHHCIYPIIIVTYSKPCIAIIDTSKHQGNSCRHSFERLSKARSRAHFVLQTFVHTVKQLPRTEFYHEHFPAGNA